MNSSYVYAYVNLDEPGYYRYNTSIGLFEFFYKPVYIGKGRGDRMNSHQVNAKNQRLNNIIKKGNWDCFILKDNMSSHLSFKVETELIYLIGRLDLKTGPLFNESAGIYLVESPNSASVGPLNIELNKILHTLKVLNETKSIKESSQILGLSSRTLYRYLKEYKIKKIEGEYDQFLD